MPPAPQPPFVTVRGNALPLPWLLGLVAGGASLLYFAATDRGRNLAEIDARFKSIETAQQMDRAEFARAVAAGQRERDGFLARFDAMQRQTAAQFEALGSQQAGLDRNAAVTAEKLAAIAASIADIQRILQERPRRVTSIPAVEAAAARAVARRDGGAVRMTRPVPVVLTARHD